MTALLVYESMFGNTELVSRAIAEGVGNHLAIGLVAVGDIDNYSTTDTSLLIVGGPTHAFSMTREGTRADAARRGTSTLTPSRHDRGIREWLGTLQPLSRPVAAATFDTKVVKMKRFPGSDAKSAERVVTNL